jgi:hypothetical protein
MRTLPLALAIPLALFTFILVAIPARAQTVTFKAADANADGAVTLEEAKASGLDWNDDALAGFDLDSNGVLNEEEFKAAVGG